MIRFRPKHVRTRLMLLNICVLGAVLLLFSIGTSFVLFFQLRAQMDRYNIQDVETVEGLLNFTRGERLELREDYHNHPESKLVLERLLEVRTPDGAILYRNARLGDRSLGGNPFPGKVSADIRTEPSGFQTEPAFAWLAAATPSVGIRR